MNLYAWGVSRTIFYFRPNRQIGLWEIFFFGPTGFSAESEKYKSSKSLKYGYKHFGPKSLDSWKIAKNYSESQMVLKNHPLSIRVNLGMVL